MVAGSWLAGRSMWLRDRLGTAKTLLAAAGIQILIIAAMGFLLSPWVALLILLRSAPRALMTAPLNAAVVPRLERAHRATYLSVQSLAGRMSFSKTLFLLSLGAAPGAAPDWPALSAMARSVALGAVIGGAALLATQRHVTEPAGGPESPPSG